MPLNRVLFFGLLSLLVACPQPIPTTPQIGAFTASPNTLPPGGGKVRFEWNVGGADKVSIAPNIGIVTGSSLEINVPSSTTYTLTATSAGGSDTKTATVTVATTMTVNGHVTDSFNQPASGYKVNALGSNAVVISDANGMFSLTVTSLPYSLALVPPTLNDVLVFKGLRRSDPTLSYDIVNFAGQALASISGTVSGGAGFPQAPSNATRLLFGVPNLLLPGVPTQASTNGAYNLQASWFGGDTITGTVHALQYSTDTNGRIDAYKGYGKRTSVQVSRSGTLPNQDVVLGTVSSAPVTLNVTWPTGISFDKYFADSYLMFPLSQGGEMFLESVQSGTPLSSATFVLPDVPGAQNRIVVAASKNGPTLTGAIKLVTPGSTIDVNLPQPLAQAAPTDGATNVSSQTVFSWSGINQAMSVVTFFAQGGSGLNRIVIYTTDTTTTIPDLSALGINVFNGTAYQWRPLIYAPIASLDEVTGPFGTRSVLFSLGHDIVFSEAVTPFGFTTKTGP
jgi:hypothetical protein